MKNFVQIILISLVTQLFVLLIIFALLWTYRSEIAAIGLTRAKEQIKAEIEHEIKREIKSKITEIEMRIIHQSRERILKDTHIDDLLKKK